MKKEICKCGHSESHMNLYDETIPSTCKHKNENGNYDCSCKKFKLIKLNNEEEREK